MSLFYTEAFEVRNAGHITSARGVAARANGITRIAREPGLAREQLYKSLSENGNPTLATRLAVLKAIGFEMSSKPKAA